VLAVVVFYGLNDVTLDAPEDDAYDLVSRSRREPRTTRPRPANLPVGSDWFSQAPRVVTGQVRQIR